jgi:hypothetical protein
MNCPVVLLMIFFLLFASIACAIIFATLLCLLVIREDLKGQQLIMYFNVPTLPHEQRPFPCPKISCFRFGVNCIPALDLIINLTKPSAKGALQSLK